MNTGSGVYHDPYDVDIYGRVASMPGWGRVLVVGAGDGEPTEAKLLGFCTGLAPDS